MLCVEAPYKIVASRFEQWPRRGVLTLPPEYRRRPPAELASEMMAGVRPPQADEVFGTIIRLDGTKGVEHLSMVIGQALLDSNLTTEQNARGGVE